ncbi:hypothetical protein HRbin25_00481 [bacterium HR25]|nr:hypothetical protein HRbin25_00481 [bacterium HR25]
MTVQQPGEQAPRLRPLDIRYFADGRESYLVLRDPLGLSPSELVLPAWAGPILGLMDGSRDLPRIQAAYQLLTGRPLSYQQLAELVARLEEELLLDGPRFRRACEEALRAYRAAPHRPPALAGKVYPERAEELTAALDSYVRQAGLSLAEADEGIVGVISPHIDYGRGWRAYAHAWSAAAAAARRAELVIALGTDHAGGRGRLTLTRQSYATPLGVLPTDQQAVEELARALGEEWAFAEELHHRNEHSLELALVWLHYVRQGEPCAVLPVLCGSLAHFLEGDYGPESDQRLEAVLAVLGRLTRGRRSLVVAAADLAHVGPAFGDSIPFDLAGRASLRRADERLLTAIQAGDADAFLRPVREEGDRWRICGLSPIYLTLRLLKGARGRLLAYEQCPADPQGGSLVSVAAVVLASAAAAC